MDEVQIMEEQITEEMLNEESATEEPAADTKKRRRKEPAKRKGIGIKTKLVLLSAFPVLVASLIIVLVARSSMIHEDFLM